MTDYGMTYQPKEPQPWLTVEQGADIARELFREYDSTPVSELQIVPVPAHDTPERWPAWIRSNPPIDDSGAYRPHMPRNRL